MNTFLPFIVIGVTTGSIYGLAATGLVLSYKTSGIFNFAYGAIAALAVFTFYFLHDEHGVAWPVAAVLSVFVLGPLMGLLLEVLARRLSRVNHMLQIAATIGLILWIVGLGSIWISNASGSFPPFLPTRTVRMFAVNVQWQQIIVVAISLVSTIGLSLFLRVTRLGRAMRGVVDDPDLVAMTGQSPTVVRRWSWVISTTFACLAGILIAPSLPVDATVLTLLVVTAFGAAAIGYFSNLPLVYVGGLFIGIVGALTTKYASSVPWLINLPAGLPFIILIVVLIVTPRARLQARRFTVPLSVPPSWHAPARVRIGFGALVVVALCFVPALVGTKLTVYSSVLILAVLILSLGVLTRTSRQVSLCQYAFAAIGGAAMGHFTSQMGIPWFLALLLAGLVTVPIGALIAIPAIRLSGVFLALATLGFGILVQNIFYTQNYMFGSTGNGISVARPSFSVGGLNLGSDKGYYFVILVVTVLMTLLTIAVSDGRLGRMLRAMGDSPLALESYGLSVNTTKVLIFCVSSFIAAISGALLSGLYHFGLGTNFPSFSSLTIFAVAVVIAVGTPWYALIGASILTLVPVYLTSSNVVLWLNVVFGIGAVLNPVFRDKMPGTPEWIRQLAAGLGGEREGAAGRAGGRSDLSAGGRCEHGPQRSSRSERARRLRGHRPLRRHRRGERRELHGATRSHHRPDRPERCWQDHDLQRLLRPRAPERRRDRARWSGAHVIERLGASSRWPRSDLPARPALRVAHGQEQHRALPRVRHRGEEPAPPAALNVSRVS